MGEQKVPECGRCKKAIIDVAYIEVRGAVILQEFLPVQVPLYRCKEHAENYAQHIPLHADWWIDTLKDHTINLHDMKNVLEILRKKAEKQKEKKDGME